MDSLTVHAARAFGLDPAHVDAVLARGSVTFDPAWLAQVRFTGDPTKPEHQAYLVARQLADAGHVDGDSRTALAVVMGDPVAASRAYWQRHPAWWGRVWGAVRWR